MGPILYAHEHKYKIFILQALSTISTCAYIRDFTVRHELPVWLHTLQAKSEFESKT